jgi:acetolactate synthase-1/3 small subunit
MSEKYKTHIISVLVENRFGVLAHISSLFSARGFNIDSLAVGETEDPTMSRMTIVVTGDDRTIEQVDKQLNRLIDVIRVDDLTKKGYIDRELVLFKIRITGANSKKVKEILKKNKAKIFSQSKDMLSVEFCGNSNQVSKLFEDISKYKIKEVTRTGKLAIAKEK